MNIAEFKDSFKKMFDVYGIKAYPTPRLDMFYKRYSSWDADLFNKAIEQVIANAFHPPLVETFADLVQSVAKEQRERNRARLDGLIRKAPWCSNCQKSGSFIAKYWDEGFDREYTAAFTCDCKVGALIKPLSSAPMWTGDFSDRFRIIGHKGEA